MSVERKRKLISEYPFLLLYQGNFLSSPTFNLSDIADNYLRKFYPKKITKRVVYLIIEMVQNIERYSEHHLSEVDMSLVYRKGASFHIVTQNIVSKKAEYSLTRRLVALKNKHQEELDEVYRSTMKDNQRTEKGAGLGLIDIARKTKNNLFHKFIPLNDDYSIFQFRIAFPIEGDLIEDMDDQLIPIEIEDMYLHNDSTIAYAGDFSNDFLVRLLDMLSSVQVESMGDDSMFKHSVIEVVQNIRRHGFKQDESRPGIFSLNWKGNTVEIQSANLIDKDKVKPLVDYIEQLNDCTPEELVKLEEEVMLDFEREGGLGLIHMAKFIHPKKLGYAIGEFNAEQKLYLFNCIFS